jgi:hypothetical protein
MVDKDFHFISIWFTLSSLLHGYLSHHFCIRFIWWIEMNGLQIHSDIQLQFFAFILHFFFQPRSRAWVVGGWSIVHNARESSREVST